ncbi:hypothetical protein ACJJTC_005445 [Scirpophaga incertulas]
MRRQCSKQGKYPGLLAPNQTELGGYHPSFECCLHLSSGLDILNLSPAAHELTEQYQGSDRPAVIYPIASGLDILNLSPAAHELTEQYQGSDRPAVIYPIASGLDILNLSPAAHELTEQYQGQ